MSNTFDPNGGGDAADADNEAARKAYEYVARNTTLQRHIEVFVNELAWLKPVDDYAFLIDRLARHSQPANLKNIAFFDAFDSYGFPCVGVNIDGDKGNHKDVTLESCRFANTMFDMAAAGHVSRMIPEMSQFSRRFVRYAKLFLSTLQQQYLDQKSALHSSLAQSHPPAITTTTFAAGCPLSSTQAQFDHALQLCAEQLLKLNPPVQTTPVLDERPTTATDAKPPPTGGKDKSKEKPGKGKKGDKHSVVGPLPAGVVIPYMQHVMSRFDGMNFTLSLLRLLTVARDAISTSPSLSLERAVSYIVNNGGQSREPMRLSPQPDQTPKVDETSPDSSALVDDARLINFCFSCMRFGMGPTTKMPFLREVFLTIGDKNHRPVALPTSTPTNDAAAAPPPVQTPPKPTKACYTSSKAELRTFLLQLPHIYMQTCERFERTTAAANVGGGKGGASAAAVGKSAASSTYHVLTNLLIPPPAADKIETLLDPLIESINFVQNYPAATTLADVNEKTSKENDVSFAAPRPTIAVPVVPARDLADMQNIEQHLPTVDVNLWLNGEHDSSHRVETEKNAPDAVKHKYEWLASGGNSGWKTTDELIAIYIELLNKYPHIRFLVDPFHHTDVAGFEKLRESIGKNVGHFVGLGTTRTVALYEASTAAAAKTAAAAAAEVTEAAAAKPAEAKVSPSKATTAANATTESSPLAAAPEDSSAVKRPLTLVDIGIVKIEPYLTISQLTQNVDETTAVLTSEDQYCMLMASDSFVSNIDTHVLEIAKALHGRRVRWLWFRSICSRAEYTDTLNGLLSATL